MLAVADARQRRRVRVCLVVHLQATQLGKATDSVFWGISFLHVVNSRRVRHGIRRGCEHSLCESTQPPSVTFTIMSPTCTRRSSVCPAQMPGAGSTTLRTGRPSGGEPGIGFTSSSGRGTSMPSGTSFQSRCRTLEFSPRTRFSLRALEMLCLTSRKACRLSSGMQSLEP